MPGWRVADLVGHAADLAARMAADPQRRTPSRRVAEQRLRDSCLLGCLHALDLAAAVDTAPALDEAALAVAVDTAAAALVAVAPGRSVELRIPGAAGVAVQCVPGPTHTRGTPPNVVETSPTTWLELAAGRLTWAAALGAGRLSASGRRADLSGYLPVVRCPGEPTRMSAAGRPGP